MAKDRYEFIVEAKDLASKTLKNVQAELGNMSGSFKKGVITAGKYGTAVAGAIGVLGGIAVKNAAEFETSMSNIDTLLGDNAKGFETLKKDVLDFGQNAIKPLGELTEATYDIISAGVPIDQMQATLKSAEKLAVTGLGSVKEATDLVTSSMNAFGVSGEEASNLVFEAVKNGKTTVAELSQGFGAVAGTAKELGVEYEEFLAITSTGTTVGKKASQVWTEQKAILTALNKPTAEMKELWKTLGVKTGKELIETSGGLSGALEELSKAAAGNDEKFAKALGSAEGLGLAQQLLGSSSEALKNTLNDMQDGVNSVDLAYKKQQQTVAALTSQMKNQFSVLMTNVGTVLLPVVADALSKVTEFVSGLTQSFKALTPEAQENIIKITGLIAALGLSLGALALATKAIGALKLAFLALTSPIGLAIAGVVALYAAYQTNFLGIGTLIDTLILMWQEGWTTIQDGLANFLVSWNEKWGAFKETIVAVWGSISEIITSAVNGIKATIDALMKSFETARRMATGTVSQGSLIKANPSPLNVSVEDAFASGGIVSKPTVALIGEAGQNEAVVPLPDGRRIPVEMKGGGNGGVNIGTINIAKEVDGDNFLRKMEKMLTRSMQLEQLNSLQA